MNVFVNKLEFFQIKASNFLYKLFFVLGFISILLSCDKKIEKKSNPADNHNLYLNVTVSENEENKDRKNKQIKMLTSFFKTNWNYDEYKVFLFKKKSTRDAQHPFLGLRYYVADKFKNLKPTLLYLSKISEKRTIAKVAFQKTVGYGFSSLPIIYNFMLIKTKGGYKLTNPLNYNTRNWKQLSFGNIEFYKYPDHKWDKNKIKRMADFNRKMADYFDVELLNFTYYVCRSYDQVQKINGYDIVEGMYRLDSCNSIADPHSMQIFNGCGSEINTHELVHLYQGKYFPQTHAIIVEGVATYLGSAAEFTFKEYIQFYQNHSDGQKIDYYKTLFSEGHHTINSRVSIKYAVGALLCDLAVKKCGKQGLFKLLNSGKSNEELLITIQELFGIDRLSFNDFIERKLKDYD